MYSHRPPMMIMTKAFYDDHHKVADQRNDNYAPIKDLKDPQLEKFDEPLPCFGCGIGWFSLLLGFVCPLMWYYATILYIGNYHHKEPRERVGLAASAIVVRVALIFSIVVIVTIIVIVMSD
ncbi:hypothetical protein RIF29_29067 [Crotalaria pallida]|uniref:60S ribosomal protein L18a-like protein n=1 Tax=Crotalaria pallida TaxID=3830 RepID=A0AAN9HVK7_CROPI